jgi:ornithine cyclodeaminase/alanine dehydrogenase
MVADTMLLCQDDIRSLITMKDVVECVDRTFQGMGDGTVINPTKVNLDLGARASYPSYEGSLNAMPAYLGWCDSAGMKWAGGFLGERKRQGLPYLTALILLIDPRVGNFRAVMEGAFITNYRTGAQTAVALKYLYGRGRKIRLGLYGAGVQGYTQTMAIAELFEITRVQVFDIRRSAAEKYAEDMKNIVQGPIVVASRPEEAAVDVDVVVCVTHADDGFFRNAWFKPGTFLFPMGSYQECDDQCILTADKIVVDHVGQTLHRGALAKLGASGRITEKNIYATVGEIAAGKKPGLFRGDERVLCVSIGTGAMDVAVATLVWQRAREQKLGSTYRFV